MKSTLRKTHSTASLFLIIMLLAACVPATPIPTVEPPTCSSTFNSRMDTWLQVLGAPDNMGGTSVVSLGNSGYAVATGFTPGLADDFGLLRVGADGQVQSKRYTSAREHSGSMEAQFTTSTNAKFPANILFVKALSVGGDKLSLAFDTVWLPEVGTDSTLAGWQVSLGKDNPFGLALTDLVKVDNTFFLLAAVGIYETYHLAILKVASNGNLIKAVEYPSIRVSQGGKMFMTDDGRLLTGGYLHPTKGREQAVVLWLNQDLDVTGSVTVEMRPYQLYEDSMQGYGGGYSDLALLPDGDIILVQNFEVCSIGCQGSGALITRLHPDGTPSWTIGFHALQIGGETFVSEIRQEGDHLILVGGSTAFEAPKNDFIHLNLMMASLDGSTGKPLWVRSLGPVDTSGDANEFKTDYAYAFLPVGDGRMIVTGTSDSFGSYQIYDGPGPFSQHLDLLLGMVGLENGGIQGASKVMWSPDVTDPYKVWAEGKTVTHVIDSLLNMPDRKDITEQVSLSAVTYTTEDLSLVKRDLESGFPPWLQGLKFSFQDQGRELISSNSIFPTDPDDTDQDPDKDCLDQAWENAALDQVKPLIELTKGETWLNPLFGGYPNEHVVLFVRVSPYPSKEKPVYVLFEYAITWSMDYGAQIPRGTYLTSPIVWEEHRGDVEFVKMAWRIQNERSLRLEWVYTAAHDPVNNHAGVWNADDPTCNRANIADTGYLTLTDTDIVGTELMCATLKFKNNHVLLYSALDKHAMYPSLEVCNHHANLVAWNGDLVWWDKCGGSTHTQFLFDAYNVGETDVHLIDDLTVPDNWRGLSNEQIRSLVGLFPKESIWNGSGNSNNEPVFCGGLSSPPYPDGCSMTVIGNALGLGADKLGILVPKLAPTSYRVSIKTSADFLAGTDAAVYITLFMADGSQYRQELDGSFENTSVDVFHIGDLTDYIRDVDGRDIIQIGLERNDNESNPDYCLELCNETSLQNINADWTVDNVQVTDKVTGHKWIFCINQELTDNLLHIYQPSSTNPCPEH